MNDAFANIPYDSLKQIFNSGINSLLSQSGLTIPVTLTYGNNKPSYCNNCVFDPVSLKSSNIYNNVGPNPFPENSVCPVCLGMGSIASENSETINMGVLFDSKYWINIDPKVVNVADNMIQTICSSALFVKIKNANEIYVSADPTVRYIRAGEPNYAGLGDTNYIFTMWKRR